MIAALFAYDEVMHEKPNTLANRIDAMAAALEAAKEAERDAQTDPRTHTAPPTAR